MSTMEALSPPALTYGERFSRLTNRTWDVLIIGGGINGAGIARDLSLRGLRVLLAEKGDFGSGTSSASTKLVHGGLRYLENRNFHLVFEACRERNILQKIAPHLVWPLPFFIPVYDNDPRPLWQVRAGMWLYDLLALGRNTRAHSILAPAEALDREPALQPEGLRGVARYFDCRMDDARLCLENILAAEQAGACCLNYCRVDELHKDKGRLSGANLRDLESGQTLAVYAKLVINAAGPWLDKVSAMDEKGPPRLRPTRGSHILVPRINRGKEALYLTAGSDQRLFFVLPWGDLSLIGTTDVDFSSPDQVEPTQEDIHYLLKESARHLNLPPLGPADVIAAFAGLRPLIAEEGKPGRVSREHQIYTSPSGLISVGGGKYTTYRSLAAEVSLLACKRLQRGSRKCLTAKVPLPGGATGNYRLFEARQLRRLQRRFPLNTQQSLRLIRRYGARIASLEPFLQQPGGCENLGGKPGLLAAEARFAVQYESARNSEDILRRRTTLALEPGNGKDQRAAVSDIIRNELGIPAGQKPAETLTIKATLAMNNNVSEEPIS